MSILRPTFFSWTPIPSSPSQFPYINLCLPETRQRGRLTRASSIFPSLSRGCKLSWKKKSGWNIRESGNVSQLLLLSPLVPTFPCLSPPLSSSFLPAVLALFSLFFFAWLKSTHWKPISYRQKRAEHLSRCMHNCFLHELDCKQTFFLVFALVYSESCMVILHLTRIVV